MTLGIKNQNALGSRTCLYNLLETYSVAIAASSVLFIALIPVMILEVCHQAMGTLCRFKL